MSILDSGPHTVKVWVMDKRRTVYGTWQYTKPLTPIIISGVTFQPTGGNSMTAFEAKDSKSVDDQNMVRGAGIWPGGSHSIIEFEDLEYDQVGKAKQYSVGARTKHYTVQCKLRGMETK